MEISEPNVNVNENKKWQPKILVLGPGGMKGFLELGALLVLESEGILTNTNTYVGVSVGAVIGLMLVCGYKVTEIIEEAMDIQHLFQDVSSINLLDIKKNTGILDQNIFKKKLSERVERKLGIVPSLKQLYLMTGLKYVAVSMNIDKDSEVYLSYETDPDLSCVETALLSLNIPFLFYKLKYKGDLHIDGAFGNPYPVDHYDDGKTDILGIYITSVMNNLENSVILYLYKILTTMITQTKKRIEKQTSARCKHLELCSKVYDSTGVTMDMKAKAEMVITGYTAAKKFLKNLHNPSPKEEYIYVGNKEDIKKEENKDEEQDKEEIEIGRKEEKEIKEGK